MDRARWAAAVVAGLRGVRPGLEEVFDGQYARRLGFAAAEKTGTPTAKISPMDLF